MAPLQGVGGDGGQGGRRGREPHPRRARAVVGIADATAHAGAHGDGCGQAAHHAPRPHPRQPDVGNLRQAVEEKEIDIREKTERISEAICTASLIHYIYAQKKEVPIGTPL